MLAAQIFWVAKVHVSGPLENVILSTLRKKKKAKTVPLEEALCRSVVQPQVCHYFGGPPTKGQRSGLKIPEKCCKVILVILVEKRSDGILIQWKLFCTILSSSTVLNTARLFSQKCPK